MGIVFRQSVKSTIVVFAGNILGALFNYWGAHVFKDDMQAWGFSRTIFNIGIICQMVTSFGSGAVILLFLQRYPPEDIRKKVLITVCSLVPAVVSLLLVPVYLLLKHDLVFLFQRSDQAYFLQYYLWIALLNVLWSYGSLYEYYLQSQQRTAQAMFSREVLLRLGNILLLGLLYFKFISFYTFVAGSVLIYLIPILILFFLATRTKGFGFSLKLNIFNTAEYKEMFRFGWSHMLIGISFSLIGYVDTVVLAALDKQGVASVPVYVMSVFIVSFMTIPYRTISATVMPVLNEAYIDRDQNKLQDVFSRSGLNLLIVTIFMFLAIGLNLENAVAILPRGYEDVGLLTFIMMLGRMVDMGTGLNAEVITLSEYYRFNFRISLLLLVLVLGLDFMLIPKYGAFGAAWGVTIAQIVQNMLKLIFVRKKMNLVPYNSKAFIVVVIGIITAAAVYFIPFLVNPVIDTIVRIAIISIIYLLLLIKLRPSPDISTYLASVVQRKRLF
jgi:O-antigen/teichoic acid export membrane protein